MKTYAVTYTFVVEINDEDIRNDPDTCLQNAVEEYVHSIGDAFSDPVSIEEIANAHG